MARICLSLVMLALTLLLGTHISSAESTSKVLSFAPSADKVKPIEIGTLEEIAGDFVKKL